MKKSKRTLFAVGVVMISMGIASCSSRQKAINLQPTSTEKVTRTVEEVQRDTVWQVEADQSQYVAELAIQGSKIVVKEANIKRSKQKVLQPPAVQIQGNKLIVDCYVEAQRLFFEWKEQYVQEKTVKEVRIPVPVPLELSWWQSTQLWLGRIFLLLIAVGSGGYMVRLRMNR